VDKVIGRYGLYPYTVDAPHIIVFMTSPARQLRCADRVRTILVLSVRIFRSRPDQDDRDARG